MPLHTARPIQSCGIEHRRAAGDHLGEDVAAGIGCPAHRLLRRAGAGQLHRIGEVDCHLEYLCFGLQHRRQAGNEALGCKKPPALVQMQPEPSVDLSADVRELGAGPVVGAGWAKFEEPVALKEHRAILGGQAGVDHQEAPDPRHIECSSSGRS